MTRQFDKSLQHAWAAGIVDGEGCISIRRSELKTGRVAYVLEICVGQSGRQKPLMLVALSALFGGSVRSIKKRGYGKLPTWDWRLVSAAAEAALRKIMPHLVGKQAQAKLAIAYRELAVGESGKRHSTFQKKAAEHYYRALRNAKKAG